MKKAGVLSRPDRLYNGNDDKINLIPSENNRQAKHMQARMIWLIRLLIFIVFFFKVQCAVAFLWAPQDYAPSFELSGAPGAGMVRGLGVLFLMWNVPYALAAWHPIRHLTSLKEAVAMQAIGLVGETLIWLGLPAVNVLARGTVLRFIIFDGAGLLLLGFALGLAQHQQNRLIISKC